MKFSFPIIDPHIHQWDLLNTPRALTKVRQLLGWNHFLYSNLIKLATPKAVKNFVGRTDFVANDYLPTDYMLDTASLPISHVVHVEVDWRGHDALGPAGETAWLDGLFQDFPVRLGAIVGHAELHQANIAEVVAAHIKASDLFTGIRQVLAYDRDAGVLKGCDKPMLARDAQFRRGMEVLEQNHLSFDAWMYSSQLDDMIDLAKDFPNMNFVLDHMGSPVGIGGPFASYGRTPQARREVLHHWQDKMEALADQSNITVKLSGLFMPILGWGFEHRESAPNLQELLDKTGPLFEFVLQRFGVDRCMFASNFPMDKVSLSLMQLYELYDAVVASYSEAERRKLFHDNAARIYRISQDQEAIQASA